MTVLVPGEAGWQHVWATGGDPACFLCDGPVSRHELAVYWMGATGDIYLHRACAPSFVMRLSRDCWELQQHEKVGP